MKKSNITIAGKTVTLGYCYATEIAYKDIAGGDINDFILEVGQAIEAQKMPDIKKTIMLISLKRDLIFSIKTAGIPRADITLH